MIDYNELEMFLKIMINFALKILTDLHILWEILDLNNRK